MGFDASIDLVADRLPDGLDPGLVGERVRVAVRAMPGAKYVEVACCANGPAVCWFVSESPAALRNTQVDHRIALASLIHDGCLHIIKRTGHALPPAPALFFGRGPGHETVTR